MDKMEGNGNAYKILDERPWKQTTCRAKQE
jgi:hypothetical protein